MNRDDVRALLRHASHFDGRPVNEEMVDAWHDILRPLHADQAMQAVQNHFSSSDRKLMPSHVMEGVKKIREDAMVDFQAAGQSLEIPDADPDDPRAYILAIREQRTRHADGVRVPINGMIEATKKAITASGAAFREATPTVVACPKCQALVGRGCRTSSYRPRSPHDERLDSFEGWRQARRVRESR